MSEQVKPKGFSAFLRPAMMGLLMIGTAGLGAAGASYLQSGKSSSDEVNPSNTNEPPQKADSTAAAEHSDGHPATADYDEFPVAQDSRADAAHPSSNGEASEDHHQATAAGQKPSHPSSASGHGDAHNNSQTHNAHAHNDDHADPFSEAALGISENGDGHHAGHSAEFPDSTHLATSDRPADANSDSAEHGSAHDAVSQAATDPLLTDHAGSPGRSGSSGKKHLSSPESAAPETTDPLISAKPSRQERATQQAVNLMSMADEELASGNYVQAMQAYQSLRQKSDGLPGVAILFRLALCAEAAGRHAAAIEAYRKISGTQADTGWVGVARYGEARCLAAMKRHEGLQTDLLRRAILDETEFLPTVRGEVLHLIGRDLFREQTRMASTDLLNEHTLIVPDWSADTSRLLSELPMLIHETPVKRGPREFQVLNLADQDPDSMIIRLNCGMTKVESLIRNLVSGCGLACEFSEQALETVSGRTQQVHVSEQSLATLLDGITISSGLAWQQTDSVLRFVHTDELKPAELRQCRLDAAERILRSAVMDVPGSPQAGHSRLALSTLLFEQKRAADALQFLQVQIESSPRSVVETEAAFNLGKCLMILNERDASTQAFLRSIDASGGSIDVKIASYIFHSRMLMEDNYNKLAIQSMMRGVSLSEGSSLEPFAALHLASLYLMAGNPQGSNSVLMERREELADGPGKTGAAFLSSLSRFRAAVLADRREREGAAVVSALTEFDASSYCGGHWAILLGGACEELGLSQEANDAFALALKKLPPSDLRNKTVLRLASRYQAENQTEQAKVLLATLSSSEADQLALQARLRAAELALTENQPDDAIAACRLLINSTKDPVIERAALGIMGRAYERKEDHQSAVYCFVGLIPEEETRVKTNTSPAKSPFASPASTGGRE